MTVKEIRLKARAKINLTLDILRRRTDYGWEFGVRRPDGRYAALALMRAEEK